MNSIGPITPGRTDELKSLARDNPAELKKAVADFEALFINQMLKTMRETIDKNELFHGGSGEEIYTSLLDTELSKDMARAGGIGLGEMLLRELSKVESAVEGETIKTELPPRLPAVTPLRSVAPEPIKAVPSAPQRQVQEPKALSGEAEPFIFPLKDAKRVSSEFGRRVDPFSGEVRFHHGLDIAARQGTPVYPAAPGRVIFSGLKGGYGNMIEVLHDNGYVTRYGHNSKNIVKQGDMVIPSEPMAYVGSTGRSTGPHLHFEVLRQGTAIDPKSIYG
ncbi:MAG TPA: hypothetical protein DDW94_04050 [Deltaproteobacteria bacterium]|nr:MAG: hypothetical protein A2Z79_10730 [Deltaproteobacteria bacterium GWA2_55_82]OGQ62902.1 MAG: hypothetical protein A3I81_06240 [Deltaproteobacteria bacterium RIFCSPLOWO2_02_FULL_55_12]OIJ72863.1 MAG: hypothetical protein A2V21_300475 [Deltaproteobacteria bacterium GWC2_55_46]HBG46144.1 hypothetical protein [Deltaproteobacteria bacterium]HCY11642.1 hypothetical protein [Deltaproteobacteria bacterium]